MTDRHEHLDEGTIHAWLDGALPPDESARVEARAQACAECAALVAEARGLIAASSRILSSLDGVPAGVIPGADADADQLAALRARRRATAPRWWEDRRFVAAASLVLVAGLSSVVWRSSTNETVSPRMDVAAESALPAASQPLIVDAPASAAPGAREAVARDSKAETPPPSAAPGRATVAASRPSDSLVAQKTATARAPSPVGSVLAANEARRSDTGAVGNRPKLVDSTSAIARLEQRAAAAEQQQLRLQGASQRQAAIQQLRADSAPLPTAPPAPLNAGLRRDREVTTGVGAAMADAVSQAGNCYRLRIVSRSPREAAIADTVKLLAEQVPVLSDPSWFRTQTFGAVRDTTLAWRSIDAVTVELRARFGSATTAVRFMTNGATPDVRNDSDARAAAANRIVCPG